MLTRQQAHEITRRELEHYEEILNDGKAADFGGAEHVHTKYLEAFEAVSALGMIDSTSDDVTDALAYAEQVHAENREAGLAQ